MPRSIADIRKANGGLENLTDEDILQSTFQNYKNYYPSLDAYASEIGYSGAGRGLAGSRVSAGIDQYQANLLGLGGAVARKVGAGDTAAAFDARRVANESAAGYAAQRARDLGGIEDFRDVTGVGTGLNYIGGLGAQALPYLGEAVAGGLTGGLAFGGTAARMGLTRAAASTAGAVGASYPSAVGDVLSAQRDAGGENLGAAALGGVPYAALNALGIEGQLARGMRPLISAEGGLGRRLAVAVPTTALAEGLSETGQEVINQYAGRMAVDPNETLFNEAANKRYLDSFVGGATLGGVFGSVGALRSGRPEEGLIDLTQPDTSAPLGKSITGTDPAALMGNPYANSNLLGGTYPAGLSAFGNPAQPTTASLLSQETDLTAPAGTAPAGTAPLGATLVPPISAASTTPAPSKLFSADEQQLLSMGISPSGKTLAILPKLMEANLTEEQLDSVRTTLAQSKFKQAEKLIKQAAAQNIINAMSAATQGVTNVSTSTPTGLGTAGSVGVGGAVVPGVVGVAGSASPVQGTVGGTAAGTGAPLQQASVLPNTSGQSAAPVDQGPTTRGAPGTTTLVDTSEDALEIARATGNAAEIEAMREDDAGLRADQLDFGNNEMEAVIDQHLAKSKNKDRDRKILRAYILARKSVPEGYKGNVAQEVGDTFGIDASRVRQIGNPELLANIAEGMGFDRNQVFTHLGIDSATKAATTELGKLESDLAKLEAKATPSKADIAKMSELSEKIDQVKGNIESGDLTSALKTLGVEGEAGEMFATLDDSREWQKASTAGSQMAVKLVGIADKIAELQTAANELKQLGLAQAEAAATERINALTADYQALTASITAPKAERKQAKSEKKTEAAQKAAEEKDAAQQAEAEKLRAEAAAKRAVDRKGLEVGDTVVNTKLGTGVVKSFSGDGDATLVTVDFQSGQTKELSVKMAKLEKTNAVQVQGTAVVSVQPKTEAGQGVGGQVRRAKKPTAEGQTQGQAKSQVDKGRALWESLTAKTPGLVPYEQLNKLEQDYLTDLAVRTNGKPSVAKEMGLQQLLTREPVTIDVESRIIDEQVTKQVAALPAPQIDRLEQHYGNKRDSAEFLAKVQADITKYVTQGAEAVAGAIRSIIKAMAEGVLAMGIVFNPNITKDAFTLNVAKTFEQTIEVTQAVPAVAKAQMSPTAQAVYEAMAPVAMKSGKWFMVADKPNGMLHIFKEDGSHALSDPTLYGKDTGDVMEAVSSLKGGAKVTPAGKFTLKARPSTYAGGQELILVESKDYTGYIAIHAADTSDASENRLGRLDTPTAADNRVSYGCINTKHDTFINEIAPNIANLDGGMVFVVPDAQEQAAQMFAAETRTETRTEGGQGAKGKSAAAVVGKEEDIPTPKPILFSKTNETVQVTQAPDLVNNGRTLDLVINGKVTKTYDLVSQGLWDAYKGRPEAQENMLQNQGPRQIRSEAIEALKDAQRVYSEQAPLSRVENDAIQALANNDTLLMKRIVTNLTIRDSVLRMLSSALSYPGQPYRDFSGLAAMSEYDSRAKLTAENILRYAPEYMLKNANIPAEFKFSKTGTPATSQNSVEDIIKTLAHVFGVLPKSSAYKSFVRISQTAEEAYKAANKKVPLAQLQNAQAFVDPSDSRVVHLIANNIPKGGEFAVLLHEVGVHVGLKNKLGENFKLLEAQVKAWANAPKSSLEFKVYEAAMARVAAARLDGAITSEIAAEELVAYAAEEAALAGVTVTKDTRTRSAALQAWIQQLNDLVVEALKNFLNVVSVPKLTTQDLVNFSYAAAQEHMESLRAEVGSSLDATDAQVSKYYAGSRGTAEGTVLDSQYGFGKEAFFWNPTDKFGSFTGIATRAFYERAESKGLGPRGVGSPAYMAMVLTSSESREFGEAQNNKQDKVLMTLQAVHEPKTNSWSLIVSGPELDGALYTDLFVNGLATKTKDNEGNEWTRLEGISRADNIRVLSEFRRRLTRIKNGEIPNIDFTRITGSGAALEEGNFKSYSADELAIRYSKAPNQGTIQRNIAKLPKASRSPVRNIVLGLGDLGGAGLDYVVFTSDLVKRAVAVGLTSAQTFADALAQRRARVSEFEREIERIADGYADIEPEFKGAGRGSVNDFLFESTRTLKWGYDSGKLKADPAMEIAFNKLGPKAQQFVKNVFAHGDKILSQKKQSVLNSANSEYDAMIQAAQDAVNAAQIAVNTAADAKTKTDAEKQLAERKQDLAEVKAEKVATLKRFQTLFAIREGKPYAPIKRDGAYVVIGKSAEYKAAETAKDTKRIKQLESDPDHYHVSFVDTKWAARTLSDNLTDQGVFTQPDIVQRATAFEETFSGEALLPALTKIRAAVDKRDDSNRSKMLNIVNQLYLEALAEGSARKSEMRRRGVAGEVDMLQSFTRQGRADANFLANVEFEPLIQDALQQMRNDRGGNRERKSEIFNELTKRYVDSLETKGNGFITGLTNTASKYFLASSPAYYMQNLTQPFMMSLPALAGRHDYTKAGKALFDAYAELGPLFKDVKLFDQQFDFSKVPADVRAAITKLVNQGQIDIGLATEINEYKVDADSKLGKFAQRLNKSMRLAVQKVEATNRLSTAIAAYRLELARLKKDPKVKNPEELATQYAADILTDTHGDYTAMNAPRIFNSQWGKVALQFRKFQLIQIAFYAKLLRDAFTNPAERAVAMRTLAFSLGHSAVFAGMMGLPGYAAVAFILKAFSDEDEPYDLTADMRQALGPEWSDLIMRGAPTLVGVDLSGKIGSGNMLSIMPFSDADLSTTAGRAEAFGTLVGGASLGMVSRVADGMGLILSGDYYKGIERTMPKGVSDALKAGRQAAEGMTRRNGDVVLPAEEISAISAILTGLGVPAVKETVTYERQNRMRDVTENFQERTTRVKNDYVRAVKDNDAAAKQSARDAWTKLQKARQENGLKLQPFSDLLKAPQEQAKRERMTIGGVQYTKGNRKLAEEIAGD
jgi:hypothetical protein